MAYVTSTIVKNYLGISGSGQDTAIGYLITSMENIFNNLIQVDTLDLTTYTDEIVNGSGERYFRVKNQPVVSVSAISEFESGNSYTGWTVDKVRGNKVWLDSHYGLGSYEYLVTYIAGYRRATISKTLTAVPVVDAGGGFVTVGVATGHGFAVGDTVTIAGTTNYNGTYTLTGVATGTVTFAATYVAETTATNDTIVSGDQLPEEIRTCISFMVGGALSEQSRLPGVASYSILGKSMTFRDPGEFSYVQQVMNQYVGRFKTANIVGI